MSPEIGKHQFRVRPLLEHAAPARAVVPLLLRATSSNAITRAVISTVFATMLSAGPGQITMASDQSPGISISGAQLPNLRPALPAAGLAAGAPGLPDAAATIERIPPGTHGVPSSASGGAPQAAGPMSPPNSWSEAEVRGAQVRCQRALAGLDAHYTFIPQVKSGACGTPAAIELAGFGKGLAISPPIIVSCDIAAALQTWMRTHVQPLANRHLGTNIVQINTMSSYACRNRYGAKNAPLSQHAFANAIDIRGFVSAKGLLLDVEQHWGPTTKELAAYQAANPAANAAPIVTAAIPDTRPTGHAGCHRYGARCGPTHGSDGVGDVEADISGAPQQSQCGRTRRYQDRSDGPARRDGGRRHTTRPTVGWTRAFPA
jgi:hypothetical protein